jgi:hypothetical protein
MEGLPDVIGRFPGKGKFGEVNRRAKAGIVVPVGQF